MKPRILIGSVIRQSPSILELFLQSLTKLDCPFADIHYIFADDNTDNSSSNLLNRFAEDFPNAASIISCNPQELDSGYRRDETTHYWDNSSIWKVAEYKNGIIQHCLHLGYDALFFVDSDLLLHPKTLQILWDTDKQIVSEIFWTKWQPTSLPLPQVWLNDEYSFIEQTEQEVLTEEQKKVSQFVFLSKLRIPGLYEVGGLGACTLIRRTALEKGVHFGKIKNLSFWGEDRHFCIRAAALGIDLYVDTHVPAFHIYRDSDLEPARKWVQEYDETNLSSESRLPGSNLPDTLITKPRITLTMVVHNEAGSRLADILGELKHFIDHAVIIDDGSTDDTAELCKEVLKGTPLHVIKNETPHFPDELSLRRQQWNETLSVNPEWILNLDADEMFESKFWMQLHEMLSSATGDVACFRLYDMWSNTHYREDQFWRSHFTYRPFLIRFNPRFNYKWSDRSFHCGRFPANIFEQPSFISNYRLKHWGWATPEIRQKKYERYKKLDPEAKYGWKEQYESILDPNPRLVAWNN
ncbi:glycosyltransferase [Paenibacillus elgii]|uniref:glycosyltransferase n=1 Tax=Paenibacillus elgii TaxID=189691 RepID=UPI0013D08D9B|nr:glycosyltransferase [Paenibacillus elgii]